MAQNPPLRSIEDIAQRAREWAERQAYRTSFADDLAGFCAIASAFLFTRLVEYGYTPSIIENCEHCFVLVDDYLVDITATQFRRLEKFKPVEIRPRSALGKHSFWTYAKEHRSVEALQNSQKRGHWPSEQIPSTHILRERPISRGPTWT